MITTFANYLRVNRGLSENTVRAYEQALHDFASYVNDRHQGTTWRTVTKQMIDEYVVTMAAKEAAPASIKQHVSALRTFFKTCQALGGKIGNPARYVSTPKLGEQLPKVIEAKAIREALNDPTVSADAKAAIAIIYETGIRLQELLDLRASDIDTGKQAITVRGKGNKQRTVYYGELTQKYGTKWHGEQHTQRGVRHMVYTALRPYSMAEQLSPHALRHTYASQLLNNGMSLTTISKLMGHKHQTTTEVYAKLATRTAQQQYLRFRPTL